MTRRPRRLEHLPVMSFVDGLAGKTKCACGAVVADYHAHLRDLGL